MLCEPSIHVALLIIYLMEDFLESEIWNGHPNCQAINDKHSKKHEQENEIPHALSESKLK